MNSGLVRALARLALIALAGTAAAPSGASAPAAPDSGGFRRVEGPHPWAFPRDHGAHPDFQTEWWYYTGHLTTDDGRSYGYELTFFRRALALPPDLDPGYAGWRAAELYPAHFALTDETGDTFRHWERIHRDSGGKAGADTTGLRVWCGDWRATGHGTIHRLEARAADVTLTLDLEPRKPPILHGEGGLSRKGAQTGQASYYYSMTRMTTHGTLSTDGKIAAVRGLSWMDHEFFSSDLDPTLDGWDWFSVQLDDETELMVYRLRRAAGAGGDWSSGTLVLPGADALSLRQEDITVTALDHWKSPVTSVTYPSGWRVRLPQFGIDLTLTPTVKAQELDTRATTGVRYWEGSVRVSGTRRGAPLAGAGYVELTGYDGTVPMKSAPGAAGEPARR